MTDLPGRYVEWVPVCPEVEVGMATPREPIRLEVRSGEVHLVAPKSGIDHTDAMTAYARRRVAELGAEDLCGYVLKKDSPSCGLWLCAFIPEMDHRRETDAVCSPGR